MSVLGRSEIIARMRNGDLSIAPLFSKDQIGAASVDLRLGTVLLMVRARGSSHVDPAAAKMALRSSHHDRETVIQQKHERFELPYKASFLLHPGALALVPTLEWIAVPSDLIGTVTARSTWAREGLSIATATLIEPNYRGIVTLELANLGQIPIALYPGLEIAQIAFATVAGDTSRPSRGQFRMSFEPRQGLVANKREFAFLPNKH